MSTPKRAIDDDLSQYRLTDEQIEFFEQNGYLGPLKAVSVEEMEELVAWMDETGFLDEPSPLYGRPIPSEKHVLRDWHLVYRQIYDICTHPAIVQAMCDLMGEDLVLWRSQFTLKYPGQGPVAWHQDLGFPGHKFQPALNPARNLSSWMSMNGATIQNGCVRVVPGTHTARLERQMGKAEKGKGLFGRGYAVQYVVDTSTAVPIVLEPGEFFLFNEKTLHGSTDNMSDDRRLGLATRVTTPDVRIYEDQTIDGQSFPLDKHGCVLIHGEDRFGYNRMIDPPAPL